MKRVEVDTERLNKKINDVNKAHANLTAAFAAAQTEINKLRLLLNEIRVNEIEAQKRFSMTAFEEEEGKPYSLRKNNV